MTSSSQDKASVLYARVQGGKVVEYPVSLETINKRKHSVRQYHTVILSEADFTNEAGVIFETVFEIQGFSVLVKRTSRYKTLQEVIEGFHRTFENSKWLPYAYNDIPDGEIKYFEKLLGEYFEDQLETVVKQRYSSLDTLLGRYRNSNNLVWKKEADYIQGKLDALWATLIQYFSDLQQGKKPLPVEMKDVESLIFPTSWDDMQ